MGSAVDAAKMHLPKEVNSVKRNRFHVIYHGKESCFSLLKALEGRGEDWPGSESHVVWVLVLQSRALAEPECFPVDTPDCMGVLIHCRDPRRLTCSVSLSPPSMKPSWSPPCWELPTCSRSSLEVLTPNRAIKALGQGCRWHQTSSSSRNLCRAESLGPQLPRPASGSAWGPRLQGSSAEPRLHKGTTVFPEPEGSGSESWFHN